VPLYVIRFVLLRKSSARSHPDQHPAHNQAIKLPQSITNQLKSLVDWNAA